MLAVAEAKIQSSAKVEEVKLIDDMQIKYKIKLIPPAYI